MFRSQDLGVVNVYASELACEMIIKLTKPEKEEPLYSIMTYTTVEMHVDTYPDNWKQTQKYSGTSGPTSYKIKPI